MNDLKYPLKIKSHQFRNILVAVFLTALIVSGVTAHLVFRATVNQANRWASEITVNHSFIDISSDELASIETIDDLYLFANKQYERGGNLILQSYYAHDFNLNDAIFDLFR